MAIDLMQEVERIEREVQRLKDRIEKDDKYAPTGREAFLEWMLMQEYATTITEIEELRPQALEGYMREYLKSWGWEYHDDGYWQMSCYVGAKLHIKQLEYRPYDYEKMIEEIGP